MSSMFGNATSFNQNISNWNVGKAIDGGLNEMFKNVSFFTSMTDKIHANGTPFNYFIYHQPPITQLNITGFYYGPASSYSHEVPNTDGSILRINTTEKLLNPKRLISKYVDFTSQLGSIIEILDYIIEIEYESAYVYHFKIGDNYNTSIESTSFDVFSVPVFTEKQKNEHIDTFTYYDIDTNNLGSTWVITNLVSSSNENVGDIPGEEKDFTDGETYTSTLKIDNTTYSNTQVTVNSTIEPDLYNIILVWNGISRTIENVNYADMSIN